MIPYKLHDSSNGGGGNVTRPAFHPFPCPSTVTIVAAAVTVDGGYYCLHHTSCDKTGGMSCRSLECLLFQKTFFFGFFFFFFLTIIIIMGGGGKGGGGGGGAGGEAGGRRGGG